MFKMIPFERPSHLNNVWSLYVDIAGESETIALQNDAP